VGYNADDLKTQETERLIEALKQADAALKAERRSRAKRGPVHPFGPQLREARLKATPPPGQIEFGVDRLAESIGVDNGTVVGWELGASLPEDIQVVDRISEVLQLNESDRRELRQSFLADQMLRVFEEAAAEEQKTRPKAGKRRRYPYDVALSVARNQRPLADELTGRLLAEGFSVFYDKLYPEVTWGKDLAVFLDEVYRRKSRYCVIFVSADYAARMWTRHELRSALARAIEEKGAEYILPVQVDSTRLPGLAPTVGYLSLEAYSIQQIADLLMQKLRSAIGK
jgi:transcriptional regulator with XRE-family HTH domain